MPGPRAPGPYPQFGQERPPVASTHPSPNQTEESGAGSFVHPPGLGERFRSFGHQTSFSSTSHSVLTTSTALLTFQVAQGPGLGVFGCFLVSTHSQMVPGVFQPPWFPLPEPRRQHHCVSRITQELPTGTQRETVRLRGAGYGEAWRMNIEAARPS